MKDDIKNIIGLFFARNRVSIMLILGIAGIFLLSVEDLFSDSKKITDDNKGVYEYKTEMEKQLEEMLSAVKGAGKVKVMITLESGKENIYAWQEKTSVDKKTSGDSVSDLSEKETYENEVVLINSGSSKTALVEKVLEPAVQGVVVVCTGADDINVKSNITNAVSVALNVTTNRICVIEMN